MFRILCFPAVYLAATSAFALTLSGTSLAQDAAPMDMPDDPVSASVTALNSAESDAVIEEIIVTAQRRSESLQDVPVSVTLVTAEALADANIDNATRLGVTSPSVVFKSTNEPGASARLTIRGIGSVGNSVSIEGAVGVFIDGVYRSRNGQALANFLDYDNVQILKGAQGTLFGKNTTAGAVLLTSATPDLINFSGQYEFRLGNYADRLSKVTLNVPLVDEKLGVRLSGMVMNRDGFVKNLATGNYENSENGYAVKASTLFVLSDSARFKLIADSAENDGNCCYGAVYTYLGPTASIVESLATSAGRPPTTHDYIDNEDYHTSSPREANSTVKDSGVALIGEFQIGKGSLTSTTAYRDWKYNQRNLNASFTDVDLVGNDYAFSTDQFSQELVFDSTLGDRFEYLIGAFFADEDVLRTRTFRNGDQAQAYWDALLGVGAVDASPGLVQIENIPGNSRSLGAFTHWTTHLTDSLSLITGLRLSQEKKKGAYSNDFSPPPGSVWTAIGAFPGPAFSASTSETAWSGTFGVRYEFTDDATGRLTYSRGFKSGGVVLDANGAGGVPENPDITPGATPLDPTYDPEYVNSYEAGLKLRYFDRRASTEIALFYNDITDLQVAQFQGVSFSVLNAKSAESYGVEIENSFQLTDAFSLALAVTWIPEAQYGKDSSISTAISDQRFIYTPRLAGTTALTWEQPVSDRFALTARLGAQYTGQQRNNSAALAVGDANVEDALTLFDLSVGLKQLSDAWSLSAYCLNCTDERYITTGFTSPLQTGSYSGFVGAPRQYGVTLRGSF